MSHHRKSTCAEDASYPHKTAQNLYTFILMLYFVWAENKLYSVLLRKYSI